MIDGMILQPKRRGRQRVDPALAPIRAVDRARWYVPGDYAKNCKWINTSTNKTM
jgi:hypothetical protein